MHVIERVLDLMETTTPVKRENVRYIYLAQFGADIIPHCIERFARASQASIRADLVAFLIQYSRLHDECVTFAVSALSDRSRKVRHNACALLAYSLNNRALPALRPLLTSACAKTADDARRAIECIVSGNHNRYYPNHSSWAVMPDDPTEPNRDSVDRYIVKLAPELVPQLERIFGDIYRRYDPESTDA